MNRNILLFISLAAALASASCKRAELGGSQENLIQISTSINGQPTRASKSSFATGDAISVYAYKRGNAQDMVVDNSINTYDGLAWSAEPGMSWGAGRENRDFVGVYPANLVRDIQSTDFALGAQMLGNDVLVAREDDVPQAKADKVPLDFTHIMSKVSVTLSYKSIFGEKPTVERVVLKCIKSGQINFLTKQVTPNGQAGELALERIDNDQYVGIAIPQTIASMGEMVVIYLQGHANPYVFTPKISIELKGDRHTVLSLSLGPDNIIDLKSTVINPWGASDRVSGDTQSDQDQIDKDPWDEDDQTILPDLTEKIMLNTERYDIPDHSELDFEKHTLSISHRGGVAELNFEGLYDKTLTIFAADPRLTITEAPNSGHKNNQLIINATQVPRGKGYSVSFRIAHALFPATKFLDFTVNVMANTIPSVFISGLEWMAYNGCGRSEDLYPPLEVGQSVRDVYRERWHKYSAICMWGERVPPVRPLIFPWEIVPSLNSNGGTSIGGDVTSWPDNSQSIPCPDGWRIPTPQEISIFWPPHQGSATGQYTRNGVTYTSSIETAGAADIFIGTTPASTLSPKIFVISFNGKEIIFPFTGWRQRNDYAGGKALPATNADKTLYIWTKAKGSSGHTAHIAGLSANGTSFNAAGNNQEAFTEAYNGVRCVRNPQ